MKTAAKFLLVFFLGTTTGFLRSSIHRGSFSTFDGVQIESYRSRLYMGQHQPLDGESVVQSLHHYRKLHSHLDIPSGYVVPNDAAWPPNLHGFRLGTVLRRIKYKGALPEYHQQIEKIGFIVSTVDYKFEVFMKALGVYQDLNEGCTQVILDRALNRREPLSTIIRSEDSFFEFP